MVCNTSLHVAVTFDSCHVPHWPCNLRIGTMYLPWLGKTPDRRTERSPGSSTFPVQLWSTLSSGSVAARMTSATGRVLDVRWHARPAGEGVTHLYMAHVTNFHFLSRSHLKAICRRCKGDKTLKQMSEEMWKWEVQSELDRPPGAVFRMPKKISRQTIARFVQKQNVVPIICPFF